jgi:hypothetical protein
MEVPLWRCLSGGFASKPPLGEDRRPFRGDDRGKYDWTVCVRREPSIKEPALHVRSCREMAAPLTETNIKAWGVIVRERALATPPPRFRVGNSGMVLIFWV